MMPGTTSSSLSIAELSHRLAVAELKVAKLQEENDSLGAAIVALSQSPKADGSRAAKPNEEFEDDEEEEDDNDDNEDKDLSRTIGQYSL
jgi:ribosomal protein L12E/L44/L45/RPP1/RPP2